MAKRRRPVLLPEQIYAVELDGTDLVLDGMRQDLFPWHSLKHCVLFGRNEACLKALLEDAVRRNYMILDGAQNDRRGLRGFTVGVGAWGWAGKVEVRGYDAWAIDESKTSGEAQADLRAICRALNQTEITFRGSGLRWLKACRKAFSLDPDDVPEGLPVEVGDAARRAHVGGPIVHVQTHLEPFCHLDRERAYGNAMLGSLPCGRPGPVSLAGRSGLGRWRPNDLKRRTGIVDATVEVFRGPLTPLLPITRYHHDPSLTRTLYPTGVLRSTWCLHELAALEELGLGEVRAFHRLWVFEDRPVLAPVVRYVRAVTRDLPLKTKRLEHMLYGSCARSPQLTKFSTGYAGERALVGDLVRGDILRRLSPSTRVDRLAMKNPKPGQLPLYKVTGTLEGKAPKGFLDRPDQAAWITATNRIEMARIIKTVSEHLGSERFGQAVGRIYVDGLDIAADPKDLPAIEGLSLRYHGPTIRIFRAGAFFARLADGTERFEAAGHSLPSSCSQSDVITLLSSAYDPDGGPFAGGRAWPSRPGVLDPRFLAGQVSEPMHLTLHALEQLGFGPKVRDLEG